MKEISDFFGDGISLADRAADFNLSVSNLSTGAVGCLDDVGIKTFGGLVGFFKERGQYGLMKIRGMDSIACAEIMDFIKAETSLANIIRRLDVAVISSRIAWRLRRANINTVHDILVHFQQYGSHGLANQKIVGSRYLKRILAFFKTPPMNGIFTGDETGRENCKPDCANFPNCERLWKKILFYKFVRASIIAALNGEDDGGKVVAEDPGDVAPGEYPNCAAPWLNELAFYEAGLQDAKAIITGNARG